MGNGVHAVHARLLRQFAYEHLPEELQVLSKPFHDLAVVLVHHATTGSEGTLLNGADVTVALRKLLEAKDSYVRAAVS